MMTPLSVSYSKLATHRRCLQQYAWRYIDKYYPPSGIGQDRGSAGHSALALWHKTYQPQPAMQAAWDTWTASGHLEADDNWQLLEDALNRYFGYSQPRDKFVMLKSEEKFDIPYALEDGTAVNFTGYIDGIIHEPNGEVWLLENKFLKQVDNGTKDLDHQASLYLLACQRLGHEVKGVLYNQIRMGTKIAETEPVVRRKVHRNPAGLAYIERELISQAGALLQLERGLTPIYRNATQACVWDCPFHSACLSLQDDGNHPTEMLKKLMHQNRSSE